jgi:hypothetical protein
MADESVASIIPWNPPEITNARGHRVRVTKLDDPPNFDTKSRSRPQSRPKPKAKKTPRKAKAVAPADDGLQGSEALIAPDFLELVEAQAKRPARPASARHQGKTGPEAVVATPVASAEPAASTELALPTEPEPVARDHNAAPPRARPGASALLLRAAALALACVGMAMNGWFAQSLGSSHVAGWMFLAIGMAADLVALVMPTCAARLWHDRHHATALAGWAVWSLTFVFAVTAGIGFASTNISEVAFARASRVTPAISAAQAQLTDAMAARDRECKGGVGKYCREREAAVAERRHAFDTATQEVALTADPQTEAAIKLVAWVSHGLVRPQADDFAMLRLVLLALLPQFGGILLMVGRRA